VPAVPIIGSRPRTRWHRLRSEKRKKVEADGAAPLPPAMDGRRTRYVLYREGSHWAELAYMYFETKPNCRSASKLLSRGEARRIQICQAAAVVGRIIRRLHFCPRSR
jgi:hypothetical protein